MKITVRQYGDDGPVILAVLCYRGFNDLVFGLCIPECIDGDGSCWNLEKMGGK